MFNLGVKSRFQIIKKALVLSLMLFCVQGFLVINASAETLVGEVDISVTKTISTAGPYYLGDTVTYVVTASNTDVALAASNLKVKDLLPTQLTFVSSAPSVGTYNSTSGIWDIGGLAASSSATLTLKGVINTVSTFSNIAKLNSLSEGDLNTANNADTVTITSFKTADLKVTQTLTGAIPYVVGDTLTYNVNVKNNGPSIASGVSVLDAIPANTAFVSAVTSSGTAYASGTGIWTVNGIAVSATKTLTLKVKITAAGTVKNKASISAAGEHDKKSSNNADSVTITAQNPNADIKVTTAILTAAPHYNGEVMSFKVTAKNNGPLNATGVKVKDLLPGTMIYISHSAASGTSYSSGTGIWDIGSLNFGQLKELIIVAKPNTATTIKNVASLFGLDQTDNVPANNKDSVSYTVVKAMDLVVSHSLPAGPHYINDTVDFTFTITNNGPDNATSIQLADEFPLGIAFISAIPTQGSINFSTGRWEAGTINSGSSASIVVKTKVTAAGTIKYKVYLHSVTEIDVEVLNNQTVAVLQTQAATTNKITGKVYTDYNLNTIQDGKDKGQPAVYVYLYEDLDSNGVIDPTDLLLDSTLTSARGEYSFFPNGGSATLISKRIATGNDDAEQYKSGGSAGVMDLTSSDLELAVENAPQYIGMRFAGLAIPQGAIITSAYITFTTDETKSVTTNLNFYAHNIDNSPQFTTATNNISSRSRTASVPWSNVPAWNTVGETHKTPNLKNLVQTIVNRSGWASGNALSIIVDGTGTRTAESYNGSTSQAPLLEVLYELSSSAGNKHYLMKVKESDLPADKTFTNGNLQSAVFNGGGLIDENNNFPYSGSGVGCYSVADNGDMLYSMNRISGSNVTIGAVGVADIETIALNVGADTLFAVDADVFGYINVETGIFTAISSPTIGVADNGVTPITINDADGMSIGPNSGNMYASNRLSGDDILFIINRATGTVVEDAFGPGIDYVVIQGGGNVDDLAIDPKTGQMYATTDNGNKLFKVNKRTGTTTTVGNFFRSGPVVVDDMEGFSFWNGGIYYGVTGNSSTGSEDDKFWQINEVTAEVTLLGPFLNNSDFESCACLNEPDNQITGTVWDDVQIDTVYDGIEATFENIKVYLYLDTNKNGYVDATDILVDSALTNSFGFYAFSVGYNGSFVMEVDTTTVPAGYYFTTNNFESAVFPFFGGFDIDNDFGLSNTPRIDLKITKTVDADTSYNGENVIFSVVVENTGGQLATGVFVSDTLDSRIQFIGLTKITSGATTYDPGSALLTWSMDTQLVGVSDTLSFEVKINDTGDISNVVTVEANENDSNALNNTASTTFYSKPLADIYIEKATDGGPYYNGEDITFTLTASNYGLNTGTNVVVTDVLSTALTFVSLGTPPPGSILTYDTPSRTITWTIESIDTGSINSKSITYVAKPNTAGNITNTGLINGEEYDPNELNNSSSVTFLADPTADVHLTKEVLETGPFYTGDTLTYRITVTNLGPDDSENQIISDILPNGTTYIAGTLSAAGSSGASVTDDSLAPLIKWSGDIVLSDTVIIEFKIRINP